MEFTNITIEEQMLALDIYRKLKENDIEMEKTNEVIAEMIKSLINTIKKRISYYNIALDSSVKLRMPEVIPIINHVCDIHKENLKGLEFLVKEFEVQNEKE
jgi:hypothetical protein